MSELLTFAVGQALSAQAQILQPNTSKWAATATFKAWVMLEFQRTHPEFATEAGSKLILDAIAEITKTNKMLQGVEVVLELDKLLCQKKSQKSQA